MFAHDDVMTQRSKLEKPLFAGQVCTSCWGGVFVRAWVRLGMCTCCFYLYFIAKETARGNESAGALQVFLYEMTNTQQYNNTSRPKKNASRTTYPQDRFDARKLLLLEQKDPAAPFSHNSSSTNSGTAIVRLAVACVFHPRALTVATVVSFRRPSRL